MGALTAKPYAFKGRPWEYKTTYSIDFLDSTCSFIKLDFKGLELIRILPVLYQQISEEWITDKIRFSVDANKRQRLLHAYILEKNSLISSSLKNLFLHFFESFKQKNNSAIALIGKSFDFETSLAFKLWARKWFITLNIKQDFYQEKKNLNFFFSLKEKVFFDENSLNNARFVVLFGCDLRYTAPFLNIKVRTLIKEGALDVFTLGSFGLKLL